MKALLATLLLLADPSADPESLPMIPRGAGETLVSCFTDVGAPGRILVYTFIYYCIINDTYLSAKTASAPKHGATAAIWRPWKSRTGSGCLIPFRLRDICASEGGIGKIGEALPARGAMRVLHRAGRLGSSRALSARIRRRRKPKPSSPTEPGGLAPTFLRRPMAPSLSGRRATGWQSLSGCGVFGRFWNGLRTAMAVARCGCAESATSCAL